MNNELLNQQINLLKTGRFEEALTLTCKLEKLFPDNLYLKFNKGYLLLAQGNFFEGYQLLEFGRSLKLYGSGKLETNVPIWDGTDLTGKTLLINMEGGVADNFLYSRIATNLIKQNVQIIYCCEERFHTIFKRIPGVDKCITIENVKNTPFDYWIPSYSSSWMMYKNYEDIMVSPYIFPDENSVEIWRKILNTNKKGKIGLAFSENLPELKKKTKFPVHRLLRYSEIFFGCQFYNISPYVQIDESNNLPIKDLSKILISIEDTIACIENLDIVITECNEIAHIAASLGKNSLVFASALPYHTWIYGKESTPWFSSKTKILRQTSDLDWDQAFYRFDELISDFIGKNSLL